MSAKLNKLQTEVTHLREQIDHHNYRYYVLDDPESPTPSTTA